MIDVELPSCPVCELEYDDVVPLVLKCGHTVCRECVEKLTETYFNVHGERRFKCPVCRQPASTGTPPKNFKLEEAIDVIKMLKKVPEPPKDSLTCTSCQNIEREHNLFICRNCVKTSLDYDITNVVSAQSFSDLESFALCGNCAIRVHISAGHETLPYFSITSSIQFDSHLTGVSLQREELAQKVAATDKKYEKYKETISRAYKEIDKMTEMMRKSKSSEIQREFAERISEECNEIASYIDSVTDCISEGDDNYQVGFNDLVATNLRDEVEKCQVIPEKAPVFVCTGCRCEKKKEKMMCCRECFEVVDFLMNDKIDESTLNAVDTNTLPICMPCVFTNHSPGDHTVVKFADVLEKYRTAEEVTRSSKKVAEMNTKFDALLNTFQQYINLVESYDANITEISRISVATRGLPQHSKVVARLDQCLKDAEPIINSLQKHAESDKSLLESAMEHNIET